WSQVDEMPISRRPSGARTTLLFSPPGTGPETITFRFANRASESPENRVTAPSELTYRRSPIQTSPSGPDGPETTRLARAPACVTSYTPSPTCVVAPDPVAQRRPR